MNALLQQTAKGTKILFGKKQSGSDLLIQFKTTRNDSSHYGKIGWNESKISKSLAFLLQTARRTNWLTDSWWILRLIAFLLLFSFTLIFTCFYKKYWLQLTVWYLCLYEKPYIFHYLFIYLFFFLFFFFFFLSFFLKNWLILPMWSKMTQTFTMQCWVWLILFLAPILITSFRLWNRIPNLGENNSKIKTLFTMGSF